MISKDIVPHSVILIQDYRVNEGPGKGKIFKEETEFTVNCFLDKDGIEFLSLTDPSDGETVHIPAVHLISRKCVYQIL